MDITSYDVSGGELSLISGDPNDVTVQVSTDNSAMQAFFSISGPADRWFGVGFGGSVMLDTYAIVVDEDGSVSEYTLGSWSAGVECGGFPGVQLQVTSNVAANNRRFVVGQHMMVRNCDTGNGFTVPGLADTFAVFGGYGVAGEAYMAAAAMGGHGSANNYTTASVAGSVSGPLMSLIGIGGSEEVTVQVDADSATQTATISLSGPDALWFGVGFGSSIMSDAYAIIVYKDGSTVEERILGAWNNGAACDAQTLSVLSNTVLSGVRSLVVSRHLIVSSGTCVGGFDFLGTADSFNVFGGYGDANGSFATDTQMGGHTETQMGNTWMLYATGGATPAPAPTRRSRGGTPTRGSRGGGRGGGRTPRPVTAAAAAANAFVISGEDNRESESISGESASSSFVPRNASDAAAVLLLAVLAVVALGCSWFCVAYYLRQRTWNKHTMTGERQPLLTGEAVAKDAI